MTVWRYPFNVFDTVSQDGILELVSPYLFCGIDVNVVEFGLDCFVGMDEFCFFFCVLSLTKIPLPSILHATMTYQYSIGLS